MANQEPGTCFRLNQAVIDTKEPLTVTDKGIGCPLPARSIAQEYQMLNVCGKGQFSTVWRARRRQTGEVVALKVLKPQVEKSALLSGEAGFIDVQPHPRLVGINRAGNIGDTRFIEMEYCPGQTLETVVSDPAYGEKYSLRDVIKWVSGVLEALEFMHSRRVTHGDVKPWNIILNPSTNQVKLIDLATSRYQQEDVCRMADRTGTWAYQAPEVMLRGERRFAGDIYSVGATLYHLATGRPPYLTIPDLVHRSPIPLPGELNAHIPEGLESVILKAMHFRHRERYCSPRAMIADLDNCRAALETDLKPAPVSAETRKNLLLFIELAYKLAADYDDIIDLETIDSDYRMGLIAEGELTVSRSRENDSVSLDSFDGDIGAALSVFADLADTLGYQKMAIAAYQKLLEEIDHGAVRQVNLGDLLNRLDYLYTKVGTLPVA